MSKYYLSLCCIIKNERYLEEFINYYRILGVEHFYIFDNESSIYKFRTKITRGLIVKIHLNRVKFKKSTT